LPGSDRNVLEKKGKDSVEEKGRGATGARIRRLR
jgi:hypothetical protein